MERVRSFFVRGCGESMGDQMGGFLQIEPRVKERDMQGGGWCVWGKVFFWETMGDFRREWELEVLKGSRVA